MKKATILINFLPVQVFIGSLIASYLGYLFFVVNQLSIPFSYLSINPDSVTPLFLEFLSYSLIASLFPVKILRAFRFGFASNAYFLQENIYHPLRVNALSPKTRLLSIPKIIQVLFLVLIIFLLIQYLDVYIAYADNDFRPHKVIITSAANRFLLVIFSIACGLSYYVNSRTTFRLLFVFVAYLVANIVLVLDYSRNCFLPILFVCIFAFAVKRYLEAIFSFLLVLAYIGSALVARGEFSSSNVNSSIALFNPFIYTFDSVFTSLESFASYTLAFNFPNLFVGILKFPLFSIESPLAYIYGHITPLPSVYLEITKYRIDAARPLPALSEIYASFGPIGVVICFLVVYMCLIFIMSSGMIGFVFSVIFSMSTLVMLFQYNLRSFSRFCWYSVLAVLFFNYFVPYLKRQLTSE